MNETNTITIVVVHDAGGAEVLSAFVKTRQNNENFFCFVAGPAIEIFRKKGIKALSLPENFISAKDLIFSKSANFYLTSIGWSSPVELDLLQEAKKLGLHTIVFLDHWSNYAERFGAPHEYWQENLPEEIYVGDNDAKILAKIFPPSVKITLVPNPYFQEVLEEYNNRKIDKTDNILFLGEPISAAINSFGATRRVKKNEIEVLDEFLTYCSGRGIKNKIILRPHPSEEINKYNELFERYADKLDLEKSNKKDLLDDLARSYYVFGMETMALVIALICDKIVVSLLPDCGISCELPQKDIVKIEKSVDLPIKMDNILHI